MSESSNGTTPHPEYTVYCAPVVIFTKDDAEKLASFVPVKTKHGNQNIILVALGATPETIKHGIAEAFVVHHACDDITKKERVIAQWKITCPILPLQFHGGSAHIFRIHLDDMVAPGSLPPPKEPVPPDHGVAPEDPRAKNAKIPSDITVATSQFTD